MGFKTLKLTKPISQIIEIYNKIEDVTENYNYLNNVETREFILKLFNIKPSNNPKKDYAIARDKCERIKKEYTMIFNFQGLPNELKGTIEYIKKYIFERYLYGKEEEEIFSDIYKEIKVNKDCGLWNDEEVTRYYRIILKGIEIYKEYLKKIKN
jgi:hypothetical protein